MTTWKRTSAALALVLAAGACTGEAPEERAGPLDPAPSTSSPSEPSPSPASRARWRSHADAPTERLEVAATVADGRLYLAGGLADGRALTVVESYDPERGRWRAEPPLPVAVHHAVAVTYRGDVVVIGGFVEGFSRATDAVYRLRDGVWRPMPALLRPRAAGGAVVIDDAIVVTGGQDGSALVAETEVFDGRAWLDRAPIPTPRDHLGVTTDGTFLYAVAGRRLSIASVLPRVERYDPARDRWRRLPDIPTARGGFALGVVDGVLIAAGGEGNARRDDGIFPQVEAFDIERGAWRRLPDMRTPRHGVGTGVLNGRLYVAVGGPTAGGSVSSTLESLTLPDG